MILTVQDLATRWACSKGQIYKQVKTGRIPFFLIGDKALRFRLKDIEDYECGSNSTAINGASTGETTRDSLSDARSVRLTSPRPNDALPTSNSSSWLGHLTPRGS